MGVKILPVNNCGEAAGLQIFNQTGATLDKNKKAGLFSF